MEELNKHTDMLAKFSAELSGEKPPLPKVSDIVPKTPSLPFAQQTAQAPAPVKSLTVAAPVSNTTTSSIA